jgi:hypothetical protein
VFLGYALVGSVDFSSKAKQTFSILNSKVGTQEKYIGKVCLSVFFYQVCKDLHKSVNRFTGEEAQWAKGRDRGKTLIKVNKIHFIDAVS